MDIFLEFFWVKLISLRDDHNKPRPIQRPYQFLGSANTATHTAIFIHVRVDDLKLGLTLDESGFTFYDVILMAALGPFLLNCSSPTKREYGEKIIMSKDR